MPAHWLDSLRSVDLRELDLTNAGTWSPARKASVALAWLGLMLVVRELVKRREAARGD